MLNLKACPRCKGDLNAGTDRYGEYLQCLQCGHEVNIEPVRRQFVVSKKRLKPGRPRKRKAGQHAA